MHARRKRLELRSAAENDEVGGRGSDEVLDEGAGRTLVDRAIPKGAQVVRGVYEIPANGADQAPNANSVRSGVPVAQGPVTSAKYRREDMRRAPMDGGALHRS